MSDTERWINFPVISIPGFPGTFPPLISLGILETGVRYRCYLDQERTTYSGSQCGFD
jgi:hypothetical protein